MNDHGQEQQPAQRRAHQEAGRDGDAVEQRVHAETERGQPAGRGTQQRLRVGLLAEVEVRRERVLEQVHAEVAEQHEQERVGHLGGLRQHPHEGGRQHEAGARGHEVPEGRLTPLVRGRHEHGSRHVGDGGDGGESQVC